MLNSILLNNKEIGNYVLHVETGDPHFHNLLQSTIQSFFTVINFVSDVGFCTVHM